MVIIPAVDSLVVENMDLSRKPKVVSCLSKKPKVVGWRVEQKSRYVFDDEKAQPVFLTTALKSALQSNCFFWPFSTLWPFSGIHRVCR